MNAVDRLVAIEDIKQLKARYFRMIDSKNWPGLEALFAADASFDISDDVPGCAITGVSEILRVIVPSLASAVSVHHGHCPEIEITCGTMANGVWAMEDVLRWAEGSDSPIKSLHGYGHYFETYRRINGQWRIQSLRLKRLRVDIEPWHPNSGR
ncbi:nuclear transport factor 2 family protein [Pseudomonas sp. B392_1p]|uniref:nuclear transport factor 2 family protein n=1 Tax=Pseudomonas sp. B392_1p TaxID=3457507 RepID=UPI003FD5980C